MVATQDGGNTTNAGPSVGEATWIPPIVTAHLPGTGGRIGSALEDFSVEELPLYALSGSGEHQWVQVEKRGMTTPQLVAAVARASGIRERDIGTAGMKDKLGITSQWVSYLAAKARPVDTWQLPDGLRVLTVTRHANKLRTGHLRGNRFRVRLVDVQRSDPATLDALVSQLSSKGLPNFFGAQRFGQGQGNLASALTWLRSNARASHFYEKLYPSVIQSELFNRTLGRRLQELPGKVLEGDVMRLSGSTRHFIVEETDREQPRLDARDILLTGPMLGPKMLAPRGAAAAFEQRLVDELGLTPADLERLGNFAPGTRRDAIIWPEQLQIQREAEDRLLLEFSLDAGSYATQVVREFTRAPFAEDGRAQRGSSPVSGDTMGNSPERASESVATSEGVEEA